LASIMMNLGEMVMRYEIIYDQPSIYYSSINLFMISDIEIS